MGKFSLLRCPVISPRQDTSVWPVLMARNELEVKMALKKGDEYIASLKSLGLEVNVTGKKSN